MKNYTILTKRANRILCVLSSSEANIISDAHMLVFNDSMLVFSLLCAYARGLVDVVPSTSVDDQYVPFIS